MFIYVQLLYNQKRVVYLGMEKTSRQKKLEYIREKNHYRFGGIGASSFKISYGKMEQIKYSDVKAFKEFLRKEALRNNKSINKLIQDALRAYFKK